MTIALPNYIGLFMLAFARIGTLVMLLPAIGDRTVPTNMRLGFALGLTFILFPLIRGLLPAIGSPQGTITILIGEIAVGLILGLCIRMVVTALQTAGTVMAQQLGMSYAMSVDPSYGDQNPVIGNFLNLLGLTLIFTTDLHHLALAAIRDSYALLPPVGFPDTGDVTRLAIQSVARGFALAIQISAPFIAFGILFNLGLGVLSRLMPQIQVFFVGLPISIMFGILIFVAAVGLMMSVFLQNVGVFLSELGVR